MKDRQTDTQTRNTKTKKGEYLKMQVLVAMEVRRETSANNKLTNKSFNYMYMYV